MCINVEFDLLPQAVLRNQGEESLRPDPNKWTRSTILCWLGSLPRVCPWQATKDVSSISRTHVRPPSLWAEKSRSQPPVPYCERSPLGGRRDTYHFVCFALKPDDIRRKCMHMAALVQSLTSERYLTCHWSLEEIVKKCNISVDEDIPVDSVISPSTRIYPCGTCNILVDEDISLWKV